MKHRCQKIHHYDKGMPVEEILGICEQDDLGYLHLSLNDMKLRNSMVIKVEFCPFCGFTKEK